MANSSAKGLPRNAFIFRPSFFASYYGLEARMMFLIGLETNTDRDRCAVALRYLNDPKRHPGMFDDPLIRSGFGLAGPDHPATK